MLQFSISFFGQISANQIYLCVIDMFDITSPSYGLDPLQIPHRTMLQCCWYSFERCGLLFSSSCLSHLPWEGKLRYESSTLILYEELSNSIFQSCQLVSEASVTPVQISTVCNVWMSSTDPLSSITNCHRLIVSYTNPVHSFIIS